MRLAAGAIPAAFACSEATTPGKPSDGTLAATRDETGLLELDPSHGYRARGYIERRMFVRPEDTFWSLLDLWDVSPSVALEWYGAALNVFDFASIRAGKPLTLFVDRGTGDLEAIEYALSRRRVVVVERKSDGELVARNIDAPSSTEIRGVAGTIQRGIEADSARAGVSPAIIADLIDIFHDQTDLSHLSRGDHFRLLYEVKIDDRSEIVHTGRVIAAEIRTKAQTYVALYHRQESGDGVYIDLDGHPLTAVPPIIPVQFTRISSLFSRARIHPLWGYARPHYGVDFAAPLGTPVRAMADGTVAFAGWRGAMGRAVRLEHVAQFSSIYGHLSRIPDHIQEGRLVRRGDVIGYVGSTGWATGPHLHLGVRRVDHYVDPLDVLSGQVGIHEPLGAHFEVRKDALLGLMASLDQEGEVQVTRVSQPERDAASWLRIASASTGQVKGL